MIRDSKTFWCQKFSNWKTFGSSTTRRSTLFWSFFHKRSWTDTIWLPRVSSHQHLTWASIQLMQNSSIFSMRSLSRWLNITSVYSKLFSQKITKVFDQWFLIILKFRIQFIDQEKLSVTSRNFMVSSTRSCSTFKKWLMNSKKEARPTCLSMHIREFLKTPRNLINQSSRKS